MNPYFKRYNEIENELIRRFNKHSMFQQIATMDKGGFKNLLIQNGFLSMQFVGLYETAKLYLESEAAKKVLRNILWDEVPAGQPTHQDNRLYDLEQAGLRKEEVLGTRPSLLTRRTSNDMLGMIKNRSDLEIMVALRVYGEVLVAETYRYFCIQLEDRFGLTEDKSRFYWEHYKHDLKDEHESGSHTDAFTQLLETLIVDEETLRQAETFARKAFTVRYRFYNQFLAGFQKKQDVKRASILVVSVLMLFLLGQFFVSTTKIAQANRKRREWTSFMGTMSPFARDFYSRCDQQLIERFSQTGDIRYYEKVGTIEACREVWGDGP